MIAAFIHRTAFSIVLIASFAVTAYCQSPDLWEAPVAKQPFETQPFRPIKPPAWLEETMGCGYTLSAMDSKARQKAAEHGVTLSEIGFVDPFYAYYDSKLLKRRSPHVPLGRLEKDIAEYKKLGVRLLGVYPPCLQAEAYETHPEWRRIATNTTEIPQIDMKKFPHGGMLCLLGPYGDFMTDVLVEIVTQYPDVSAFSFDGLHYGGVCYCQHCRENYRKDAKAEIPNANMNDSAFRRYQHWADRKMEGMVQKMQSRLKAVNPNIALVTWSTNAGRFGHFLSIPRNMPARMNLLFDAPDQEFWCDETNRGTTIVPAFANAYIWATTNHRIAFSEPYILSHGNPYGRDSFPPHEIQRRMMLALTYGATPSIAVAQPANLQKDLYDCMDEVQKRKGWLTHKKPEPWGAIVMSDNTRNFYGRSAGEVEERYLSSVLGTFRMAVEEHLPFCVINDWNLNAADLSKFKVLVLPNTACLDDSQVGAIDEYVRQGGGLVASLDTSMFDEFGDARKDFALSGVLGVHFQGTPKQKDQKEEIDVNFAQGIGPDYWKKRKGIFDFRQEATSFLNQGKMITYVGPHSVTFKGPAVSVKTEPGTSVVGHMRVKGDSGAELPAIVTRPYGKGRVVYCAAGLDAAYYLYSYPYQRLLLKHAALWAGSAPPPIAVEAPMCVHAQTMRQTKEGERLVVHLFNDINTSAHHALPVDDVPLREEVVPIHDIKVTFENSYRLGRIHLEPGGLELKGTQTPAGTTVIVPRLNVHSMVVAELQK